VASHSSDDLLIIRVRAHLEHNWTLCAEVDSAACTSSSGWSYFRRLKSLSRFDDDDLRKWLDDKMVGVKGPITVMKTQ